MYLLVHPLNHLFGRIIAVTGQRLLYALDAKLLVGGILGLGQSVGVEEDGGVFLDDGLLHLEFKFGEQAYWDVRNDGQGHWLRRGVGDEVGNVMTGVAVAEPSGGQIEHADEEGDEDVLLVAIA